MSARPDIGQLRHRLTIESPGDTPDDEGGVTRVYTASGALWAQIRTLGSVARRAAERDEAVVTHHILFRSTPALTCDMRLRLGARLFRILALDNLDERQTFMRAHCEEIRP